MLTFFGEPKEIVFIDWMKEIRNDNGREYEYYYYYILYSSITYLSPCCKGGGGLEVIINRALLGGSNI